MMLALTFSTGIVDAVGYLGLDKVFTGNMTGNVVILGMALTGAEDLPVLGPVLALACFLLGAVAGGRVMRAAGKGWTIHASWLFAAVGTILAILSFVTLVAGPVGKTPLGVGIAATIGAAMGLQASGARHIGIKDVTTVVVTSTLTALAAESRLAGGRGQPWFRRASAVVIILAGAACGAFLLHIHMSLALLLAAAISLSVSAVGHRWLRSQARA
ncbi:YoaK family protein [Specibacter cremeus]|uniref:YoaK family protein n=1 Tax=Specibacter cremeus TaxID=1629051 RepID=UPI000F7B965B|nr:YoaK family protein [Specibacter cremeus]